MKNFFAFLRRSKPSVESAQPPKVEPLPPAEQALLREIRKRSNEDPLIGAKIGSKVITQYLSKTMESPRGVHPESLLCALGALAGYACQAALRAQAVTFGMPETGLFTSAKANDGKIYFFGDDLNKLLAESQYSVWSIAGGGAQQAGCAALPDVAEMFKHASLTVGTDPFGVPRVPERNKPHDKALNYAKFIWPKLKPLLFRYCPNPGHWPILLAMSVQEVIITNKAVVDPCIALRIAMEAAIPMSKIDLTAP